MSDECSFHCEPASSQTVKNLTAGLMKSHSTLTHVHTLLIIK